PTVKKTVPVPPTQTDCPPVGTARALVTAPLVLGNHQTIIYRMNEATNHTPTSATLIRYDVITRQQADIVKLSHASIENAQVSANGQWILFSEVSANEQQDRLMAVRMDGQGLQTLYCGIVRSPQWSTDGIHIAFTSCGLTAQQNPRATGICLLNTTNGRILVIFAPSTHSNGFFSIYAWLDTTRIYLSYSLPDSGPSAIDILDISKGPDQTEQDLLPVAGMRSGMYIGGMDSSYDGKQLFIADNSCSYGCTPTGGDITVQPALGGTGTTLYNSGQYSPSLVRTVTPHTLLFLINNTTMPGGTVDRSHNGLWTMQADGSGQRRLLSDDATRITSLNGDSQFPWPNVSRDGTLYTAQQLSYPDKTYTYTLLFGSLQGGTPTTFASATSGTDLAIVGWTTI
ncbi:MAG TPA: hypothetical protein VKX46_07565, partial [Ktedonobacteraceae bacterium]|nr:hypothetical protein [Ktedonobacteraceae bacterium]